MSLVARLSELTFPDFPYPRWAEQRNQAATYPRTFLDVAADLGAPQDSVLQAAGIDAARVDDPAGRLSLLEIWHIVNAAVSLTDNRCLGFRSGLRMPLTAHGSLGYALMCAPTPREAIAILQRFWHLRGRGLLFSIETGDDSLFMDLVTEFPVPEDLRDLFLSSVLTSIYQGMTFVFPQMPGELEMWLQGPEPEGFEALRSQLPRVRFNQPRSGMALLSGLSILDRPLPTANPEALKQAIAQCERESALMDPAEDIVNRTRAALQPGKQGYPSPDEIAATLYLTPRTFRRRLQEQGLGYQGLLEEARRRDSQQLLADDELEIQRIATLLGYNDPANFTRAFKRWTGQTPQAWRSAKR